MVAGIFFFLYDEHKRLVSALVIFAHHFWPLLPRFDVSYS